MNCPNCKTEMEKGVLGNGHLWMKENLATKMDKILGKVYVYAHKCPKCGKIEPTSEVE